MMLLEVWLTLTAMESVVRSKSKHIETQQAKVKEPESILIYGEE